MAGVRRSAVVIPAVTDDDGLRVLVGRRHPRSSFLGGFFAFPGGAHEPEDGPLGGSGEDPALRRTAVRELREETGLACDPADLLPAGTRVTPPFGPRRFHTRMYVSVRAAAEEPSPEDPGELLDMHWVRPSDLMDRWRALEVRIAPPLIPMLQLLATGRPAASLPEAAGRLAELNERMEADGPHIEFVPHVHTALLKTPTLPPATHTNCYLVGSEEMVVIDPGSTEPGEHAHLLRHLERREEESARPVAIALTHHHGDHVGGAARLARERELPVWAHAETWERWPEGAALRDAPGSRRLADGDRIRLSGGEHLEVLHTPGHAPGHVALLERGSGSLFSGDLVSGVSTVLVDSTPGSMDTYLRSLERIRDCGARTLFPGHGFPFIDPARGVQRVIAHRLEREQKILAAMGGGARDVPAIVRVAYADTPRADPGLAAAQARTHLDRLEGQGRVRRRGDTFERVS